MAVVDPSQQGRPVRTPDVPVTLSTASVYPLPCPEAFAAAARLGYDGVEVMVWNDPVSQDPEALRRLSRHYGVPVLSVHAPTLLLTQRVWGRDPWGKITRSVRMAGELGASTVVVHPPFRWQREYAAGFVDGIAEVQQGTDVAVTVENMYPWRAGTREVMAYAPGWDPTEHAYEHVTLDLSHTATASVDGLVMARALGGRLRHLHLADGVGLARDEHLVPGRGTQPAGEVLEHLAEISFTGTVVVEVSTRRARSAAERDDDLAESLAFARLHLAAPAASGPAGR